MMKEAWWEWVGCSACISYHCYLGLRCMVEVGEFWLLVFFGDIDVWRIDSSCRTWILSRDFIYLLVYMVVGEAKDWGFGE